MTSQFTKDFGDGPWTASFRFDPGSGDLQVTCTSGTDLGGTGPDWQMGWDSVQIGPAPSIGGFVGGLIATIAVPTLLGLFGVAHPARHRHPLGDPARAAGGNHLTLGRVPGG